MGYKKITIAAMIARKLKAHGVRRMFGIPGGGSSLDLIAECASQGIIFQLAKREDSAVIMAAVTAELTGTPGVVLTTKGPGISNAMNGVAYASLDRAPVLVFTDGFSPDLQSYVTHQVFDQKAMLQPITKGHSLLTSTDPEAELDRLLLLTTQPPVGPVHVELTAVLAGKKITVTDHRPQTTHVQNEIKPNQRVNSLIAGAKRPVVIIGLEARDTVVAQKIVELVERLRCPALVTYKAKGVIADSHVSNMGIFTGGKVEQTCVSKSDLIILIGLDPVELILKPWPYNIPVLDIALIRHKPHYTLATETLYGALAPSLDLLQSQASPSIWTKNELVAIKNDIDSRMQFVGRRDLNPQSIVQMAQRAASSRPRITVDAGAHMISATAFSQASEPFDLLISNGLATMGFAVPAAVAAALENPSRGALAFTGDGGFMMCASELALAAQTKAKLLVIVFNDASLSLISIKQRSRNMVKRGTEWPRLNFAKIAVGLGCHAWQVENVVDYQRALQNAFALNGPSLIDVVLDPDGYAEQLAALRG
jgi:acetolactate synthase-1/2/3 large subunit